MRHRWCFNIDNRYLFRSQTGAHQLWTHIWPWAIHHRGIISIPSNLGVLLESGIANVEWTPWDHYRSILHWRSMSSRLRYGPTWSEILRGVQHLVPQRSTSRTHTISGAIHRLKPIPITHGLISLGLYNYVWIISRASLVSLSQPWRGPFVDHAHIVPHCVGAANHGLVSQVSHFVECAAICIISDDQFMHVWRLGTPRSVTAVQTNCYGWPFKARGINPLCPS